MEPDLVPVQSSNLRAIGYDAETHTLFVKFIGKSGKSDSLYSYADVPHDKWLALLNSVSKGAYLSSSIKGQYTATRMG